MIAVSLLSGCNTATPPEVKPGVWGSVEEPTGNLANYSGYLTIKGWYWSDISISRIDVYVDGNKEGEATYGLPRLDIQSKYKTAINGAKKAGKIKNSPTNFGFEYLLNTKHFKDGDHELYEKIILSNGTTFDITRIPLKVLNAVGAEAKKVIEAEFASNQNKIQADINYSKSKSINLSKPGAVLYYETYVPYISSQYGDVEYSGGGSADPLSIAIYVGGVLLQKGTWLYNEIRYYLLADDEQAYEDSKEKGVPAKDHSVQETGQKDIDPKGEPLSSKDQLKYGETVKRRYYDENGKADLDIDYSHGNGDGTHEFPHRHDWDWSKTSEPRNPNWYTNQYDVKGVIN